MFVAFIDGLSFSLDLTGDHASMKARMYHHMYGRVHDGFTPMDMIGCAIMVVGMVHLHE